MEKEIGMREFRGRQQPRCQFSSARRIVAPFSANSSPLSSVPTSAIPGLPAGLLVALGAGLGNPVVGESHQIAGASLGSQTA